MSNSTEYRLKVRFKDLNLFKQACGMLEREMEGISVVSEAGGAVSVKSKVGNLRFENRQGEMVATARKGGIALAETMEMLYKKAITDGVLMRHQYSQVETKIPVGIMIRATRY
jgi:hypothetical protein